MAFRTVEGATLAADASFVSVRLTFRFLAAWRTQEAAILALWRDASEGCPHSFEYSHARFSIFSPISNFWQIVLVISSTTFVVDEVDVDGDEDDNGDNAGDGNGRVGDESMGDEGIAADKVDFDSREATSFEIPRTSAWLWE